MTQTRGRADQDETTAVPGAAAEAMDAAAPLSSPTEASAALRARIERLEAALDVARLGVWRRDLRTGTTEWSAEMFRLFGLDPARDPLSPAEIDARLTPASVARRAAALAAAAPGERFETELEVLGLDGVRRWLLQRGECERDETGAVVAIHGTAFDISRRHQAEVALEESEARFRASLDSLLEGCMLIDRDWRYLYLNEAAARQGHGNRDELLGRTMLEMYPGVEASEVFGHYRRCMEERVVDRFDAAYEFQDGTFEWYEFSVQPVPEGILVLTIDRTAERKAAIERENAAARDRLLVEESADGIARLDAAGRVLDANPAFLSMLSRTNAEVLGHALAEFLAPEAEARLDVPSTVDETTPTAEHWLALPHGGRVLAAARLRLLPDGSVLVSARDVTQERERTAQREEAARLEALGRLAGGVAHDFNNLMTAVIGAAVLVQAVTPETDPRRDDIDVIREAAERAAALTTQLLAFGRRQLLRPTPVGIRSALAQLSRLLQRTLRENVVLRVAAPDVTVVADVDPAQLEQIVTSLVLNAQDALPVGGTITIAAAAVDITPEAAAGHGEVQPGRYVRVDVSDDGAGIDPAVLPHIFEPFFTTKSFGHGYGLGLASVLGITAQSGGWIEVTSEPGAGSVFSVFLPAAPAPATAAPHREPPPEPEAVTVLLVEDDAQVRAVTARLLHQLGYRVVEAASGGEAMALDGAALEGIDLLMTDIGLADGSGVAVADRLVATRPGLPVLFVSGYASPEVLDARLGEAGVGFLPKPYSRTALAAALADLLPGTADDRANPEPRG